MPEEHFYTVRTRGSNVLGPQMSGVTEMQVGVDSFGGVISDPATGLTLSALQRMDNLLDEMVLADQVGLDVLASGNTTAEVRGFGSAL